MDNPLAAREIIYENLFSSKKLLIIFVQGKDDGANYRERELIFLQGFVQFCLQRKQLSVFYYCELLRECQNLLYACSNSEGKLKTLSIHEMRYLYYSTMEISNLASSILVVNNIDLFLDNTQFQEQKKPERILLTTTASENSDFIGDFDMRYQKYLFHHNNGGGNSDFSITFLKK